VTTTDRRGRAWAILTAVGLAVAVASAGLRHLVVPLAGSIADRDREQALWQLETAFLLDSLTYIALAGLAILALLAIASLVSRINGLR
jgi:hypothetical protein